MVIPLPIVFPDYIFRCLPSPSSRPLQPGFTVTLLHAKPDLDGGLHSADSLPVCRPALRQGGFGWTNGVALEFLSTCTFHEGEEAVSGGGQ
jgi:hypothetical protein